MKYYKVIKDGRVIDALNKLSFVRYQKKHNQMLLCSEADAQAILSSDGNHAWHEMSLNKLPVECKCDTVSIQEIDQYEYNRLKFELSCDLNEVLDSYTMLLIERGVL